MIFGRQVLLTRTMRVRGFWMAARKAFSSLAVPPIIVSESTMPVKNPEDSERTSLAAPCESTQGRLTKTTVGVQVSGSIDMHSCSPWVTQHTGSVNRIEHKLLRSISKSEKNWNH